MKSLAIEWLGIIACKIKTGYNTLSGDYETYTPEWVCNLNEILPIRVTMETPVSSMALLDQCRKVLLENALKERVSSSVTNFYLCHWGFMETVLWSKANKGWEIEEKKPGSKAVGETEQKEEQNDIDIAMMDTTGNVTTFEEQEQVRWPEETAQFLGEMSKYYWLTCLGIGHPFPKLSTTFALPEMSRKDYGLLTEVLASRQTLYTSFNFILSEILTCLEKDGVIYRAKALKAIGKIAAEVPEILEEVKCHQMG